MAITRPITADNLPYGPMWDSDGACFVAERCDNAMFGCDWRWVPKNRKAFKKGEPQSVLHPFVFNIEFQNPS